MATQAGVRLRVFRTVAGGLVPFGNNVEALGGVEAPEICCMLNGNHFERLLPNEDYEMVASRHACAVAEEQERKERLACDRRGMAAEDAASARAEAQWGLRALLSSGTIPAKQMFLSAPF